MRRTTRLVLLALIVFAVPGVARATGIVETGDQIQIISNNSNVHAGPFLIDDLTDASVPNFTSFCIEYSETILISGTYYAKIADVAVGGGRSRWDPVAGALTGVAGEDPLSARTAYIYRKFLDGTLVGYDGSSAARDGLQLAIWRLEGEAGLQTIGTNAGKYVLMGSSGGLTSTVVPGSTTAAIAKANQFFADAIANGTAPFANYGVRVMQLWANYNPSTGKYGGARQDQLVSVRTAVPEPGTTLSTMALGLSALALVRRRLRR